MFLLYSGLKLINNSTHPTECCRVFSSRRSTAAPRRWRHRRWGRSQRRWDTPTQVKPGGRGQVAHLRAAWTIGAKPPHLVWTWCADVWMKEALGMETTWDKWSPTIVDSAAAPPPVLRLLPFSEVDLGFGLMRLNGGRGRSKTMPLPWTCVSDPESSLMNQNWIQFRSLQSLVWTQRIESGRWVSMTGTWTYRQAQVQAARNLT